MQTRKCPECEFEISDTVRKCPNCKYKLFAEPNIFLAMMYAGVFFVMIQYALIEFLDVGHDASTITALFIGAGFGIRLYTKRMD